jgi:hypothetical protein
MQTLILNDNKKKASLRQSAWNLCSIRLYLYLYIYIYISVFYIIFSLYKISSIIEEHERINKIQIHHCEFYVNIFI